MLPKTIMQWRQDPLLVQAGQRLNANPDFREFVRVLESNALLTGGLPQGSTDIDIARAYGEKMGRANVLGFIYTMDQMVPPPAEGTPVDFGAGPPPMPPMPMMTPPHQKK